MIAKRKWPWVAQQNWQDVLFIHTPVPYETLQECVPYPFKVDTYQGMGWVTIVLFQATHSRLRCMPEWLSYPSFCQMNIRTYVQYGDERGVYFFSINVDDRIVQLGGTMATLPFSTAHMNMEKDDKTCHFSADHLFGHPHIAFNVTYTPHTTAFTPQKDSLPYFLTERYCIWTHRNKKVVKAPIYHTHWDLQHVRISIHERTHLPFPVTHETIAHYACLKHAFIHPFETFN